MNEYTLTTNGDEAYIDGVKMLTQSEFAKEVGVTPPLVTRMVTGRHWIKLNHVKIKALRLIPLTEVERVLKLYEKRMNHED